MDCNFSYRKQEHQSSVRNVYRLSGRGEKTWRKWTTTIIDATADRKLLLFGQKRDAAVP